MSLYPRKYLQVCTYLVNISFGFLCAVVENCFKSTSTPHEKNYNKNGEEPDERFYNILYKFKKIVVKKIIILVNLTYK